MAKKSMVQREKKRERLCAKYASKRESLKEELKNRLKPLDAINAGYERAIITIVDANLTTLIVALILYTIGTGPVQGFAITLSVGILTSMFTAILVTRFLVWLIYRNRKNLETLWI